MTDPQDFTKVTIHPNEKLVTKEAQPKEIVGGRYEVISLLGRGGMGLVYRVRQIFLDKEFALKMLDKNSMTANGVRRFQQEAKATFSLKHPTIVAVNDFGVLEDQTPFLVMELVHGETLAERLKRLGPMEMEELIQLFVPVCLGLAYAHKMGIIHRDIKPSNIMLINGVPLGADGSVKIVDFGIAKFTTAEQTEAQALTRTGEIIGSPFYMSPEQCSGSRVDHRSDVYSLGCVMFEALTGAPPLMGENALTTMMKHQTERPMTLKLASLGGNFPQGLEKIVATLLAKSPDDRYNDIARVADDLKALERGEPVSGSAVSADLQRPTSSSASSVYAWVLGIALASLALFGLFIYHPQGQKEQSSAKNEPALTKDADLDRAKEEILKSAPDSPRATDNVWLNRKLKPEHLPTDLRLSLGGRNLTDANVAMIANTQWITDLALAQCSFEDNKSFSKIAKMEKLVGINLKETNLNDDGAARLSESRSLNTVLVPGTLQLSDVGVRKLTHLKALIWLDLSKTETSAEGLKDILHADKLKFLLLNGAKNITDQELLKLSLPKLDCLALDHTDVSFDGIKALCKRNNSIKKIELRQCKNLRVEDLERLRELFKHTEFSGPPTTGSNSAVQNNHGLEDVSTSDKTRNQETSTSDTFDAVGLAAANKEFATSFLTEHASETDIEIDPDMADELAKKRPNLFNKNISDDAFEGFKHLYRVTKLQVLHCGSITDRGMRYVLDNHQLHLTDVNLNSTPVTDETVRALLSIPSLKVLGLESTKVTDNAFKIQNESVQSLTLNKTSVGDAGLSYLRKFSGLRSLAIADTKITDDGIKQLESLPLWGLWISDTGITDSAANSIACMKDLTTLSVSGTRITGKFLGRLKSLNNLKSLEVRRCPKVTPDDIDAFQLQHKHCKVIYKPKFEFFADR